MRVPVAGLEASGIGCAFGVLLLVLGSVSIGRDEMDQSARCTIESCEQAAVATIGMNSLCRPHFISTCFARIGTYTALQNEHRLGEVPAESLRRFIHDCMRGADRIEQEARDIGERERTRLDELILLVADLGRHLRRSPRKAASIRIKLRSKRPVQKWEEVTETRVISRHGALTHCGHPLEIGQSLRVIRVDDGKAADARVAWCQGTSEGLRDVGIEFQDCPNFWGLDWEAPGNNP